MCVCVRERERESMYACMRVYVCLCVCVCVCLCVCVSVCLCGPIQRPRHWTHHSETEKKDGIAVGTEIRSYNSWILCPSSYALNHLTSGVALHFGDGRTDAVIPVSVK